MRDIWGFLLQTLTASGAAVLLLLIKAMFRDKLSPRWQLSAWGLLAAVLLVPAGIGGRYCLFNWPWLVETLKTIFTGDYGLTRVTVPIPLLCLTAPQTPADWLFVAYLAGTVLLLLRYAVSYLRLRLVLRRGKPADGARAEQIAAVAVRYALPTCRAVEVPGLSSAFICGFFRPVLALPAGEAVDDKVLLHELLHLKHRDVLWGLGICVFRCVHWCNPLLWYCADRAGNDVETACDQRVLEKLEGEERRDYGRILLSVANEKYARAPGTSSMANGGKNIRRRIEAIARFKRYPSGMALVSVCVLLVLAAAMMGTSTRSVYNAQGNFPSDVELDAALASARTTWCTTPAGALDTYGKSLLEQSGIYRAMCAPIEMQAEIAARLHESEERGHYPAWDTGLPCWPNTKSGYDIYNLEPVGEDAYEGLMVVELNYPPDGRASEEGMAYLAVQTVRTEKEGGRWIVTPLETFRAVESAALFGGMSWGCEELPAYVYRAETQDIRMEVRLQKIFEIDNVIYETSETSWLLGSATRYDTVPKPDAEFDGVYWNQWASCTYIGDPAKQNEIGYLGASIMPVKEGEMRPALRAAGWGSSSGSSSTGEDWGGRSVEDDWGPTVMISGGGSSDAFGEESFVLPANYAADLYVNRDKTPLTLLLAEGGAR